MAEKFYVYEVTPNNQVVRRRIYIGTARGAKAWASRRFYNDALLELVTCDGVLVARRINGRWKNGISLLGQDHTRYCTTEGVIQWK